MLLGILEKGTNTHYTRHHLLFVYCTVNKIIHTHHTVKYYIGCVFIVEKGWGVELEDDLKNADDATIETNR